MSFNAVADASAGRVSRRLSPHKWRGVVGLGRFILEEIGLIFHGPNRGTTGICRILGDEIRAL
jgi:hypothetical protein